MKDIKGILTIVIIFVFVSIIWIIISNFIGLKPVKTKIDIEVIELNLKSVNTDETYQFYNSIFDFDLITKSDSILILNFKKNKFSSIKFTNKYNSNLLFVKSYYSFEKTRNILDNLKIKYTFENNNKITFYDLDSNKIVINKITQ